MQTLLLALIMHPFHVSLTEAEWNAEAKRFELAMRLDPRDLHRALSSHAGEPIHVERTEPDKLRAAIMRYVRAKFPVVDSQGRKADWHWVGLENETKHVWLYLELQPPETAEELIWSNQMIHEIEPSQVNTIILREGSEKQTLTFSRLHKQKTLRRQADRWLLNNPKIQPN